MTAHACATLIDGCYRCDLNKDEIRAFADSLVVTRNGVVHDPDCGSVNRDGVSVGSWSGSNRFSHDRACTHCMPDGLPDLSILTN